jgi:hypothetical protein
MSAHAAAAGAGCCCNPPAKPCTCLEYGMASDGVDFDRLAIEGNLIMQVSGKDCCGAQLTGSAAFTEARVFRVNASTVWVDRREASCPTFLPLGSVVGVITSTVGQCTYLYECCNYTGCPTVTRRATHSQLPWFWCADTEVVQTANVCINVICQCDEGGVPCGGNCPSFAFEDYTTASPETLYVAIRAEVGICGIAGTAQGSSYVKVELVPVLAQEYDRCETCGLRGSLNLIPGGGAFTGYWVKQCRFPGDTVRGIYEWSAQLSGGLPTRSDTVEQECSGGYLPGGTLSVTRSIIASPLLTVS